MAWLIEVDWLELGDRASESRARAVTLHLNTTGSNLATPRNPPFETVVSPCSPIHFFPLHSFPSLL